MLKLQAIIRSLFSIPFLLIVFGVSGCTTLTSPPPKWPVVVNKNIGDIHEEISERIKQCWFNRPGSFLGGKDYSYDIDRKLVNGKGKASIKIKQGGGILGIGGDTVMRLDFKPQNSRSTIIFAHNHSMQDEMFDMLKSDVRGWIVNGAPCMQ